jgi:hypothetical protein
MYPCCLSLTGDIYNKYFVIAILPVIAKKFLLEMKEKQIKSIHNNATPHSKINMGIQRLTWKNSMQSVLN